MDNQASDSVEKIRQQFDSSPYPRIPLDQYPVEIKFLYLYNLVTAYYLRYQKVVESKDKLILDAGCGSGFKSLALAIANPGAKIIGIDLSEASVKLALQRLHYHGFQNVEFHAISIYDLPKLGLKFDYIHCDETLYLLPEVVAGLKAMRSVLHPEGIIRTNLHSSAQRQNYYRAQQFFKLMGFMDETPGEIEIDQARQMMKALKDAVVLKAHTWAPERENNEEWYLANYLLQGDRGYTIPEMFAALKAADLEFISMVNWTQWELLDLFQEPNNLPAFMGISLPELLVEERLYLYELLHPVHRLLDFWCGHPNAVSPYLPITEWTDLDWRGTWVHLHPSLRVPKVKQEMLACVTDITLFEISQYLPFAKDASIFMDSTAASCLVPLLEQPQSMMSMVQHWLKVRPVHPVTLEPIGEEAAFEVVKRILMQMEQMGFVLLERRLELH